MERSVASLGENNKLRKLVVGGSWGWNEDCLTFPNNSHLSMTLVNGVGCLVEPSHKTVTEAAGPVQGPRALSMRVDASTAGAGRPMGHRALQFFE
jgi:hypothetical protein